MGLAFVASALAACGPGGGLSHDGGAGAGGHGGASGHGGAAAGGHGGASAGGAGGSAGASAGASGGTGTGGAGGTAPDGGAGTSGGGGVGADAAAGTGAGGAGGAAGAGGAGGTVGAGGTAGATQILSFTFSQGLDRNVDVVFMVDDSTSMVPLQNKLTAAFPSYIAALKALPGGLPDIHIGVISSTLGAGREATISQCAPGGDQGIFHAKPLGGTPCTLASLNAGQNFISNVAGQPNFTGDISNVFACIALLGSNGCGFEHQLASVMRALGIDGAPAPPQNANFLRPDALLQVILLTNEDDCSAPPDSDLFSTSSTMVSDPLGPLQSYRCNEFGHLCGGKMPPRQPAGETDLGMCVSNEAGPLIPVGGVVTALKAVKADPRRVLVAAITGPAMPYKVNLGPSSIKTDPSMWPYVEHSCQGADLTYADPAVRIKQWTDGFGVHGLFQSLCADNFTAVLQAIAGQVGDAFGPPCLPAAYDPAKCALVDSDAGHTMSTPLRQCASSADVGPCWYTKANSAACATGQEIDVNRPTPAAAGTLTTVSCVP
jgi:hypothetical protein